MASPVVAGVAAMLIAQNPARTPEDVENILATTADKTGSDAYANGWNALSRRGMLFLRPGGDKYFPRSLGWPSLYSMSGLSRRSRHSRTCDSPGRKYGIANPS